MSANALINIAMGILGLALSLIPSLGKLKTDSPRVHWLKRLTGHGWISIALGVALALLVAVKEVRVARQEAADKIDAARQQADLKQQLATAISNAAQLEAGLASAKGTINELHTQLSDTRADLDRQSLTSLTTALATSDQKLKDVIFAVRTASRARTPTTFAATLLPAFDSELCKQTIGVDVAVNLHTKAGRYWEISYFSGDAASQHQEVSPKNVFQYADRLERPDGTRPEGAAVESANGRTYILDFHTAAIPLSVAELYLDLSDRHFTPVEIRMRWPAVIDDRQKFRQYEARYPRLFNPENLQDSRPGNPSDDLWSSYGRQYWDSRAKVPPCPSSCEEEVREYFSSAFREAVLWLLLDHHGQSEMISYTLKALKPIKYEDPHLGIRGEWRVGFVVASAPAINATFDFDTGDLLDLEWPEDKK